MKREETKDFELKKKTSFMLDAAAPDLPATKHEPSVPF